jgi:lauroyl/myristoyl acyltransferase
MTVTKKIIFPIIRWVSSRSVEIIRIVSMQFILLPTAYALPKKFAMLIANFLALFLIIFPEPGRDVYYQMRRAFGKGRFTSLYLTWGWLALPFRDYVLLRRLIKKREDPLNWKIIERNIEGINTLRTSGESYILIAGHFEQGAMLALSLPNVSYNHLFQTAIDTPKRIRSLHDLRIWIKHGALLKILSSCFGRDIEILLRGGDLHSATKLYNSLREPGNVVLIALDAVWDKSLIGSYQRPFAGEKKRVFSMGAVQLARMTRCPLICCVPWIKDDGNIVLEWGDPIRIDNKDVAAEFKVMDTLLDTLEIAVGKRPTQYYFEIGDDRQWDSQKESWEDLKRD